MFSTPLVLLVVISLLISTSHAVGSATTAANNKNNNDEVTHQQKDSKQCERLPTSLTYKQDAAPADVSGILRVVVDKINRDVTGVVDVEVKWGGTLYILICVMCLKSSAITIHMICHIIIVSFFVC